MARYLDDNISPDDITADNIYYYDKNTTDVINQIQFVDMANFSSGVTGLSGYKQHSLQIRHLKDTLENRPSTAEAGAVFFIKEI